MNDLDAQFYKIVGKKIRELRIEKGLTLTELANKLEVTSKTIQRYEVGDRKIDVQKLKKIADVLGLAYEDFVMEIQRERFPELKPVISSTQKICVNKLPLTTKEEQLIEFFRKLNNKGKERLLEDAEMYAMIDTFYKKEEIE